MCLARSNPNPESRIPRSRSRIPKRLIVYCLNPHPETRIRKTETRVRFACEIFLLITWVLCVFDEVEPEKLIPKLKDPIPKLENPIPKLENPSSKPKKSHHEARDVSAHRVCPLCVWRGRTRNPLLGVIASYFFSRNHFTKALRGPSMCLAKSHPKIISYRSPSQSEIHSRPGNTPTEHSWAQ